jgi:acyl carrier protein
MEKQEVITELGSKISDRILNQSENIIQPNDTLISSGLIDSFSLVDLAIIIEELYGVRIEDYELNADAFDNLSQLADLILAKTG